MKRRLALPVVAAVTLAALFSSLARLAASPPPPAPGTILTVAGTGKVGFSGDGGPAIQARLNTPAGLATDRLGNLFIADGFNNRVRKVSPDGTISTVAGGGHPADHLGDGGPATAASLNAPFGLAVDVEGNLFVGDIFNNRIRRVSAGGTITTVAGNGKAGYSGDGGPATEALLNGANTIAVDTSGNLFFTDFGIRAVRRVSTTGIITRVAGRGTPADGLGDNGPATNARFKTLSGVAVDATGNVFISDWLTERVRRVSPDGIITTVVGGGNPADGLGDGDLATRARLKLPRGVAVDPGGNLFVSDNGHFRVRKVGPDGIITTVAGSGQRGFSGDGGPATEARLNAPINLAIDRSGNLFIGDSWQQAPDDNNTLGNNCIREVFGGVWARFLRIEGRGGGCAGVRTPVRMPGPSTCGRGVRTPAKPTAPDALLQPRANPSVHPLMIVTRTLFGVAVPG